MGEACVAVPFARPENLRRVLRMWRAQTARVPLVLATNDPGGGWVKDAELAGAAVIAEQHPSIGGARNAGQDWARAKGFGWVIQWDDDNEYLPGHVGQVLAHVTPEVDALSQGIAFVRHEDALWLYETPLRFCPGHSSAFRAAASPRFPEVSLSEDVGHSALLDWSRVGRLPPWHSVYDRTGGGHACGLSRAEFLRSFGPARRVGAEPDSFAGEPRDVSGYPLATARDEAVFESLERRLFDLRGRRAC